MVNPKSHILDIIYPPFYSLTVLAVAILETYGYSTGAPEAACKTFEPEHNSFRMRSPAPVTVTLSARRYTASTRVESKIDGL